MSLNIGIVGLPNVGKSTLFQALTKKNVDRSNYPFATIDPNVGVVQVPDERLWKLSSLSNSQKTIPAIIEFVDIAGLVKGAAEGEGLGNKFLAHIRDVDAIVEVVRVFEDESVVHVDGRPNPERDIAVLETELILKDMESIEKALEKAAKDAKTGDKKTLLRLEELKKLQTELASGKKAWEGAENLLTAKPILYCFNSQEENQALKEKFPNSVFLNLKKELEEEEKLPELAREAYWLLGLITFFTTGEDETRAWTIPKGSKAPRAGRAIHGDFEEKFIKASVISYEKLVEAGSLAKAREAGWLRTEGKEYLVQDGD